MLDAAGTELTNPLLVLRRWLTEAIEAGAVQPHDVTLATTDRHGRPSSRTVEVVAIEDDALLFSTNIQSRKGRELQETAVGAVTLYWRETSRAVNVTGAFVLADDDESDRRFAAEQRFTQAAHAVARQGELLEDEQALDFRLQQLIASDETIARPAYWCWFRIVPDTVSFWEGRDGALNRRWHWSRAEGGWHSVRLQP